jgi:hypothetical protein
VKFNEWRLSEVVTVHISERYTERMLRRIRVTLTNGGERYVNVYPSEGCMMVRAGTEAARRLLRSGSPAIAGPFDALTGRQRLARAIREAGSRETRRAPKRQPLRKRGSVTEQFPSRERARHAAYKRAWREKRRAAGMRAS